MYIQQAIMSSPHQENWQSWCDISNNLSTFFQQPDAIISANTSTDLHTLPPSSGKATQKVPITVSTRKLVHRSDTWSIIIFQIKYPVSQIFYLRYRIKSNTTNIQHPKIFETNTTRVLKSNIRESASNRNQYKGLDMGTCPICHSPNSIKCLNIVTFLFFHITHSIFLLKICTIWKG